MQKIKRRPTCPKNTKETNGKPQNQLVCEVITTFSKQFMHRKFLITFLINEAPAQMHTKSKTNKQD